MEQSVIYTIGHSTHSIENLIKLLKSRGITAIADVRSAPYSRFQPQFNREPLTKSLKDSGIEYVFVGDSIGGRSSNEDDYENGRVVYSRLKNSDNFENGLQRVVLGSEKYQLALMCSEKEPIECHRTLLVGQTLFERGIPVTHILGDGTLESHDDAIQRLLKIFNLDEPDLFRTNEEVISEALLRQEQKVAFTLGDPAKGRLDSDQLGECEDWTESI
jgi:uncharacterized protein (DUF488 family)